MTTIQLILFIGTFIFSMSVLYCIKEAFKLYKSVKSKEMFETKKHELLLLGLAISFILTFLIFI